MKKVQTARKISLLAILYSCGNVGNSLYFFRMNAQADTESLYTCIFFFFTLFL